MLKDKGIFATQNRKSQPLLKTLTRLLFILISIALLSACNPTRKVERRGGFLLVKNTIKSDNSYFPYDELEGFIQQSAIPGRLTPYFRPGIWFYERGSRGKDNGLKRFMRNSLGTPPIILDSNMAVRSAENLSIYLRNKGFYHSKINYTIAKGKKTAKVVYQIEAGSPCIVTHFSYNIQDTYARKLIMQDTSSGLLRRGMIYDTYVLGDERDRISGILRNHGYYSFSLSDVTYLVDTSGNGMKATVEMRLKKLKIKQTENSDSIQEILHPRYFINNIYVNTNADGKQNALAPADTLEFHYHKNKADTAGNTIYILYNKNLKIKPSLISSLLQFEPGSAYNQAKTNLTYKKLISKPIIRSASISMNMLNHLQSASDSIQFIDCNIKLLHNPSKVFDIGTEGTNSAGRLGMGVNSSIQHRNIFRGAELLFVKIKTSAEVQAKANSLSNDKLFLFFNTLEAAIEGGIEFPRILLPYRNEYMQTNLLSNSSLNAGLGIEFRPDYQRKLSSLSWNYNWQKNETNRHTFTPIELNFVNISNMSTAFEEYLESLIDPQFKAVYTDHLLTLLRYSLVSSNNSNTKIRKHYYLRATAETSGNMGYLADNILDRPKTESGYYERFGVRYSQFFRSDFDFRRYWKHNSSNTFALRFMAGIAIPYGNSDAIPFEKSFWLGGANDMRGWKLRSLGPGGYSSTTKTFDRAGNIIIQSSIEHRFPIYSFLLGSVFADAGNVWLLKPSDDFPNGEFTLQNFAKQIAVDAGLGLRFDFSFFIFRVDWALPLHQPTQSGNWFSEAKIRLSESNWNFGIGYPF